MQFKVTMQYENSSEVFFAEFFAINDVKVWIDAMILADTNKKVKPIYRLYENDKFVFILNAEDDGKQSMHGDYADGDSKLPETIENPFSVTIRDESDKELTIAKFSNLKDAKSFVDTKLAIDADYNIDMTYYLLDNDKFVEKSDQSKLAAKKDAKYKHMIRPSPLSNRLRPRGSAYGIYNTDEDDDENKKK